MEDSPDDYDLDMDHRTRDLGGRSGRIILLGDGTEVLTDSADTEMFDNDDEEKDSKNQMNKTETDADKSRSEREGTPGPTTASEEGAASEALRTPQSSQSTNHIKTPSSTKAEASETPAEAKLKAAIDSPPSPEQIQEPLQQK